MGLTPDEEATLDHISEVLDGNRDEELPKLGHPPRVISSVPERDLWLDDSVQFPRLIAEILATQPLDFGALCGSMDLEPAELHNLLDRADTAWERAKLENCQPAGRMS